MLFKDLEDCVSINPEDDGAECPLKEDCCGGCEAYFSPDGHQEPYCVAFKLTLDTDMTNLYQEITNSRFKFEDREEKMFKKEQDKKEKNAIITQKRRQYKYRHFENISKIKQLKKSRKSTESFLKSISAFAQSVNFANELFEQCGNINHPKDVDMYQKQLAYNETLAQIDEKILILKHKIATDEKAYKLKLLGEK